MAKRKSNHLTYLTEDQVAKLLEALKRGRNGQRNYTMGLLTYRHGLRAAEACDLQWQDIDLKRGRVHVRRLKSGVDSVHPLQGDELRALKAWQREQGSGNKFVFTSEQGGPLTPRMFGYMIRDAGKSAELPPCHPHILRHSCGYALANQGQNTRALGEYLGHANLNNTRRYTALNESAFKDFWR